MENIVWYVYEASIWKCLVQWLYEFKGQEKTVQKQWYCKLLLSIENTVSLLPIPFRLAFKSQVWKVWIIYVLTEGNSEGVMSTTPNGFSSGIILSSSSQVKNPSQWAGHGG